MGPPSVNQSYEWVERAIVFRPELQNGQSAVRDGLLEAGVDPYNGLKNPDPERRRAGGGHLGKSGRSGVFIQATIQKKNETK